MDASLKVHRLAGSAQLLAAACSKVTPLTNVDRFFARLGVLEPAHIR